MNLLNNGIEITFIGHSTFLIKTSENKNILIDPWLNGNPSCPDELKELDNVDIIAITHGHFDHMNDALSLAIEFSCPIISNFEICGWFEKNGIKNCMPMNKGGNQKFENIQFIMTHAQHSSGIRDDYGNTVYGGEPAGFVLILENDFRLYHAGDTNLFSDMKLIAELYKPELSMIPIGDLFTMSPYEASFACRYLKSKYVIPMHYGTFPALTGTPEELEQLTSDIENLDILKLKPGEKIF